MMGEDYLSSESFFGFLFKQVIEALRHICPASIQIIFEVLNEKKENRFLVIVKSLSFIFTYACIQRVYSGWRYKKV